MPWFENVFGDSSQQRDDNLTQMMDDATKLSWKNRIIGFLVLCILGFLLTTIGFFFIVSDTSTFAILYSIGTIMSILSTGFLLGFFKQAKNMLDQKRWIATVILLISIILTLCSALWWELGLVCILFVLIQYLAFIWYSISYIPFARQAVIGCFNSIFT